MAGIIDQLITIIFGTISGTTRAVRQSAGLLEDFFVVRMGGISFVVFGSRQVGKTTLIHWLRKNMKDVSDFDPEPTASGGAPVPAFAASMGDEGHMRLKPTRDVGGEYAMWETDWVDLFRETHPRGVIFMMDHTDIANHKDALNFVMQMIEDEPAASKNLRAFFIVVNKADLWADETNLDAIMANYRNETRRLSTLADRIGFRYAITSGSLVTGRNIKNTMRTFFNTLRPSPKVISVQLS